MANIKVVTAEYSQPINAPHGLYVSVEATGPTARTDIYYAEVDHLANQAAIANGYQPIVGSRGVPVTKSPERLTRAFWFYRKTS